MTTATPSTADAVKAVLSQSRNGCNQYIRYNPLTPRFIITDGVQELAEAAGCYWLLDLLATELAPMLIKGIRAGEIGSTFVDLVVKDGAATISATTSDEAPPIWTRAVAMTDFPEGTYTALFEIGTLEWDEETQGPRNLACILLSEH